MHILHLDSSILGDASASRALSAALVAQLLAQQPGATVVRRDLVANPVAHLDGAIAAGFRPIQGGAAGPAQHAEHARSEELVRELLASDVIVIGSPMYNLSIPSQLKAWIDRVVQPGMTFRYTDTGPVGLAGGKHVIVVSTRGGMYSDGPAAAMDFQEAYLKAVFGFMGIDRVQIMRAENLSRGREARAQSLPAAHATLAEIAAMAG
ncbi:FMN-dependent NADH-azoreductase [Duganella sp. Leaf126]|uniref:FMN-dependent NADH-azoreductase n=1 Tax=Duganella sp. Leaf126 TaxID=1736266 RepID=UPI0006FB66F0|nr:FMN-dependent NADH-azoreductase [Duganella sp. Leaf126]KQQ36231.1 FMN-dependent NADH-azoreductase [Duganella sp. Leaf126]